MTEGIVTLAVQYHVQMKTISVTDFSANLKHYLDAVILDPDSVVINRGSTGAVLISLDEYNSIKGTEEMEKGDRCGKMGSGRVPWLRCPSFFVGRGGFLGGMEKKCIFASYGKKLFILGLLVVV